MELTSGRSAVRWAGLAVRSVLLVILLWGALITSLSYWPSAQTVDGFRAAVAAGEVERVTYRGAGQETEPGAEALVELTWTESPLIWHQVEGEMADDRGPYTVERLLADARPGQGKPEMTRHAEQASDDYSMFSPWFFRGVDGTNLWWIGAAWVAAFLLMLGSAPRLASRWAWFWMFTVGQIGAILYLLLEPRKLWRGPGEPAMPAKRVDGGRGFLMSIGLGFISAIAALLFGQLIYVVLS